VSVDAARRSRKRRLTRGRTAKQKYPIPRHLEKDTAIARIRRIARWTTGCLLVSGDQADEGAALNAVLIAEELLK